MLTPIGVVVEARSDLPSFGDLLESFCRCNGEEHMNDLEHGSLASVVKGVVLFVHASVTVIVSSSMILNLSRAY